MLRPANYKIYKIVVTMQDGRLAESLHIDELTGRDTSLFSEWLSMNATLCQMLISASTKITEEGSFLTSKSVTVLGDS